MFSIEGKWYPDNCPWGKLPLTPWIIVPEDNFPLDDCSRTITSKVIALWPHPSGNCPLGKLPFGWFVACIISPGTNDPEENFPHENCPRDELHPIHFVSGVVL